MKTRLLILLTILAINFSCDRIEGPYILSTGVIEGVYTGPGFPVLGNVEQKVLIEKFTGHGCINCPVAAEAIEHLAETYIDRVIPISVYAGLFADPAVFSFIPEDLRTDYGEMINTSFGIAVYPTVMVNRMNYPNATMIPSAFDAIKTEEAVAAQLAKEPKMAIQLQVELDEEYNRYIVYANVHELSTDLPNKVFIQLLLVENNILAPQIDHGGLVEDYQHNHVLRYSATTNWGYDISNKFSENQCKLMIVIPKDEISNFKLENLQLIAIVYNADNLITTDVDELEVLQVESIGLQ